MIDYAVTLEFDKETENIIQELIDEVAKITGWNTSMLKKEKFTYDMKVFFLSINQMIQTKKEGISDAEVVNNNSNK